MPMRPLPLSNCGTSVFAEDDTCLIRGNGIRIFRTPVFRTTYDVASPNALRYLPYVPLLFPPPLALCFYLPAPANCDESPPRPSRPGPYKHLVQLSREGSIFRGLGGKRRICVASSRQSPLLARGPKSGKKITLNHGLSIPAICYAKIVPMLVDAGYYVLLYDLYTRGYSDAPQGIPYDAKLYATQLALLQLVKVKWDSTRLHILPITKPDPSESTSDEIACLHEANLRGFAHAVASSVQNGSPTRMRWAFHAPLGPESGCSSSMYATFQYPLLL
ncbi:hypothetical protein DFH07DRAFT_763579 [Mycena maculata]|uniref:Uncharacterized protein n=1 Tax=Mycena maculata TaxID=230809 RepID=A0AAD7KG60_9AGAR|nr:hypothetical protein DFH07DRAFT_763579 [Mycena maculata]